MKLLGKKILNDFTAKHTLALSWIENWVADVEGATWSTTQDIKKRYSSASFLENNLVIFNVKGNDYRLEVRVAYNSDKVLVVWAGTHAEYDKRNKLR